ncbi:hypothetical protein BSLA_02r1085 [Burkholderia stabilis]|nr:hypothetical protein BSLA_02r1085 [Burkholderia stabilis]
MEQHADCNEPDKETSHGALTFVAIRLPRCASHRAVTPGAALRAIRTMVHRSRLRRPVTAAGGGSRGDRPSSCDPGHAFPSRRRQTIERECDPQRLETRRRPGRRGLSHMRDERLAVRIALLYYRLRIAESSSRRRTALRRARHPPIVELVTP